MTSFYEYALDQDRVKNGVRIPVYDRDGKLSDDWVQVRSQYSDDVSRSLEQLEFKLRNDPGLDVDELKLDARVTLISDWSFDEECSQENVKKFLMACPHIADRIDKVAGTNKNFFMPPDPSSLNGLEPSSHSSHDPTEANELSGST